MKKIRVLLSILAFGTAFAAYYALAATDDTVNLTRYYVKTISFPPLPDSYECPTCEVSDCCTVTSPDANDIRCHCINTSEPVFRNPGTGTTATTVCMTPLYCAIPNL